MNKDYDIVLISCPSKVIDYPALSLPMLTGSLKRERINVVQMDLNIQIKDEILTAKNLRLLYQDILPFLIRENVNSRATRAKLNQFYNLLQEVEQKYSFEMLEIIKEKCQNREYDFLKKEQEFAIMEFIFQISKQLDFLFSFIFLYMPYFEEHERHFF